MGAVPRAPDDALADARDGEHTARPVPRARNKWLIASVVEDSRYLRVAIVLVVVGAAVPIDAWAEPIDPQQVTSQVKPISSGPVVAQGTAAFDPSGTHANAQSHWPDRPLPTANGPGVTFEPVPNNLVNDTGLPIVRDGTLHLNDGSPPVPVRQARPGSSSSTHAA